MQNRVASHLVVLLLSAGGAIAQSELTWSRPSSIGPRFIRTPRIVYDSARQVVVLVSAPYRSQNMETWEWNGSKWRFLLLKHAPPAVTQHMLAYDPVRKVTVLFGGVRSTSPHSDETWEWDGATWTERLPTNRPPGRKDHVMAFDAIGKRTVLFGGSDDVNAFLHDTWEWDGTNWRQRTPTVSPKSAFRQKMTYEDNRKQCLLYGNGETWGYDGSTKLWTKINTATQIALNWDFGMAHDPVAGITYLAEVFNSSRTWIFDGVDWKQVISTVVNDPIDTLVYTTFGGSGQFLGHGSKGTWRLDPIARTWTRANARTLPQSLSEHMVYHDVRNKVFLFVDTETWEGSRGIWTELYPPISPSFSRGHSMAYDSDRNRVVTVGPGGETWEWDSSGAGTWIKHSPTIAVPGPGVLAYDRNRKVSVMFRDAGDTWEWDGNNWGQINLPGPSNRSGMQMVYDAARRVVVLFGGNAARTTYDETWTYDGAAWTNLALPTRPPPRSNHLMVYDSLREKVIVFGGSDAATTLTDTWAWNGVQWTQEKPVISPLTTAIGWTGVYDRSRSRIFAALGDGVIWEYGGGCAIIGQGHPIFGGLPISCGGPPVLGKSFSVSFTAPAATSLALFFIGPALPQALVIDPPVTCLRGFLHVTPTVTVPAMSTAPTMLIPIPNLPALANVTLATQGVAVGGAGCLFVSDALQFTILD